MADFIPKDNNNLVTWATNLRTKIDTHGPTLGMTAAQITAFKAVLLGIINAAQAVTAAKTAFSSAVANLETVKQTDLAKTGLVRTTVNQWKTGGLLTAAMEQDMSVVGTPDVFDPTTYKAKINAEVRPGFVRITFKKLGVDGLNIYVRLAGQTIWRKLSFDSNSPYDDHAALAVAGTAEVREYRALGVIADEEIGQPSDIVSVTFGG